LAVGVSHRGTCAALAKRLAQRTTKRAEQSTESERERERQRERQRERECVCECRTTQDKQHQQQQHQQQINSQRKPFDKAAFLLFFFDVQLKRRIAKSLCCKLSPLRPRSCVERGRWAARAVEAKGRRVERMMMMRVMMTRGRRRRDKDRACVNV